MTLQMQYSRQKEFSFYQKKCERCLNITWPWKSFQEWMGFLFSWTSKVILNIAAFIVFYCLHDCFKGFLCFSQKIMQRIFCDVFLEIIVYAQTKMLFDEWIDIQSIMLHFVWNLLQKDEFFNQQQKTMNDVHNKHSFSHRSLLQSVFLSFKCVSFD